MKRLIKIQELHEIPKEYLNTPIGLLLEYHNLYRTYDSYDKAQLLIGMCMDNRKHLHIPENFSYIIRAGGANLKYSEFKVSYAIAIGQVKHIVVIGHNNCGMTNLSARKTEFVKGLTEIAGWDKEQAEEHFKLYAERFEIGNEIDFTLSEVKRLRLQYPKIIVAPMFYIIEDNMLYIIRE